MEKKGKTILVVDDEPDVVKYLCSLLEDNGFDTLTARDGREGMALVKSHNPHLISLDVTMPKSTGVRMLRDLSDDPDARDIPVLLVTGVDISFKKFIQERKQVVTPVGYFEKPIDKAKFLEKICEILKV